MAPSTFAPAGDGGAAAGRGGPLEEECSYIFVSLEGVTDRGTPYGEIGIDGLLGDQPTVVLRDGRTLTGAFDEDAGSTMYFCRQALKRAGDAHNRESNGLRGHMDHGRARKAAGVNSPAPTVYIEQH